MLKTFYSKLEDNSFVIYDTNESFSHSESMLRILVLSSNDSATFINTYALLILNVDLGTLLRKDIN